VHKVLRSEVGGLKIFEIGEKYYFEDMGLRNVIRGMNRQSDVGKLMENAVFLHLLNSGYRVYVGKVGQQEIDFVGDKNGQKMYVQVTRQITDVHTQQREFGNLLLIDDNYPKYVITLNDPMIGRDYKGIQQFNLNEFLTREI
jgi:hypothetical protein